jgi:hypothetical protein
VKFHPKKKHWGNTITNYAEYYQIALSTYYKRQIEIDTCIIVIYKVDNLSNTNIISTGKFCQDFYTIITLACDKSYTLPYLSINIITISLWPSCLIFASWYLISTQLSIGHGLWIYGCRPLTWMNKPQAFWPIKIVGHNMTSWVFNQVEEGWHKVTTLPKALCFYATWPHFAASISFKLLVHSQLCNLLALGS